MSRMTSEIGKRTNSSGDQRMHESDWSASLKALSRAGPCFRGVSIWPEWPRPVDRPRSGVHYPGSAGQLRRGSPPIRTASGLMPMLCRYGYSVAPKGGAAVMTPLRRAVTVRFGGAKARDRTPPRTAARSTARTERLPRIRAVPTRRAREQTLLTNCSDGSGHPRGLRSRIDNLLSCGRFDG